MSADFQPGMEPTGNRPLFLNMPHIRDSSIFPNFVVSTFNPHWVACWAY